MSLWVAILIVLGAAAAAALALALVRHQTSAALMVDSGRGRPMITVTGTLVAVVLAFVILAAFQTYSGAKTGAQTEASAVLDMSRTAAFFPSAQRDELRGDFVCYGRAVVDQEWPAMRHGRSSSWVDYWIGVYRDVLGRLNLHTPREQLAFQELLNQAATRTAGRQQRLSEDSPTVPTPLWLALIFGGCVAVAVQLGMADPRERLLVQGLLLAGLASVVAAGLVIVYFLDHPYTGNTGGIEPTAMHHALTLMRGMRPSFRIPCGQTGRPL